VKPTFDFRPVQVTATKLSTDNPYGTVGVAYRMPGSRSKDYATAMVLSGALSSQRAALAGMGFDGTALAGGFAGQLLPEAGVGYALGIFPRGGNPQPIRARIRSIMATAASKGLDPALVEAAKRKAIAGLEFKKNSVAGLANAWSSALAFQNLSSPDAMKQAIASVTPAQVDALAKRVFDPAHAITFTLMPESSGKPVSGKGFGGAESFASSPDKPVTLPEWAENALAKLEVPRSTLHPVASTLPNGLRLIVQPESISDTVMVFGRIHANEDIQAPKDDKGVAGVLDGLYQFGTTHLNRLQFQQALDAISARVGAGSSFSLAVPAPHFEDGMKLLADNELNPALPARAFAIVQHQAAAATAGQIQSPGFLAEIGMDKALYPADDPVLRYATPQSIMGLTLDKVKAYMAQAYRPDMTTIVIVGKVDPAQARKVVAQTFGAWKAQGPKPDVEYAAVPPNKPGHLHVPDSSAVQDSVQMTQTIDVTQKDPDRYALQLGNQVLGGGFYASRLYHDLRDESGLVYTVNTGFGLDKHRGTYTVSYGCDPDKVAAARAMIVRDVKQMQTAPVSATDLKRAKGILLRRIPLGESSFGAIGGQLLSLSIEGKPLDAPTIAGRHYLQLTAPDIQAAYAKHIRPDAFVTAVKGPAPRG
jgi:zinc protease